MSQLQITAKFKIQEGQIDKFKDLASECLTIVNEKEKGKGLLQYDWFITPDNKECVVRETYRDSNALLTHLGNVGNQLGAVSQISEFSAELCGNPSPELSEALKGMNVTVYHFHQGL